MIWSRNLPLAIGVLIFTGLGMRVWALVDHSRRTLPARDEISDVMDRLRGELARVSISRAESGGGLAGYLDYHEGPSSSAIDASRIGWTVGGDGDTDDRLAMTVQAAEGSSFRGTVPWGVLEAFRAQSLGRSYTLPARYDPSELRSIESKYAEVAYWMGPPEAGDRGAANTRQLYRRVLILHPGLRVTSARLAAAGREMEGFAELTPDHPVLGYLRADGVVQPHRDIPATSASNDGRIGTLVSDAVLAFDVQVLDPEAPIFIDVGADGEPGSAGVDENGNGIIDHQPSDPEQKDRGEFGAVGSDDPVVTPSDPSFFALVRSSPLRSVLIARGTFVDNGYAIQSGGNVRLGFDDPELGNVREEYLSLLSTRYSGIDSGAGGPQPRMVLGGRDGNDERVTLKISLRYRSATSGKVYQVEAIREF